MFEFEAGGGFEVGVQDLYFTCKTGRMMGDLADLDTHIDSM